MDSSLTMFGKSNVRGPNSNVVSSRKGIFSKREGKDLVTIPYQS